MINNQKAIYNSPALLSMNRFPCVILEVYDSCVKIKYKSGDSISEAYVKKDRIEPLCIDGKPVMAKQKRVLWWPFKKKHVLD